MISDIILTWYLVIHNTSANMDFKEKNRLLRGSSRYAIRNTIPAVDAWYIFLIYLI